MKLKPFLLFLSTFYLISCTNSVAIHNDELSEDEYVSRVLTRLPRSPNIWNLQEEKRSPQQKKNVFEEQQEGLRRENIIYIRLEGDSERSKETSEEKHESSLWSILGKTTDFLAPSFVREFLPWSPTDDSVNPRADFNLPPFYSDYVENHLLKDEDSWLTNLRSGREFIPI